MIPATPAALGLPLETFVLNTHWKIHILSVFPLSLDIVDVSRIYIELDKVLALGQFHAGSPSFH